MSIRQNYANIKLILNSQIKQTDKDNKLKYINQWKTEIQSIHKLECYNLLNREFELAQYLTQIKDPLKRQTLTKYRLSDHKLAIETGRHKREWLERSKRICPHCESGEVETEIHFLTNCSKYKQIRDDFFIKFIQTIPDFLSLHKESSMIQTLLGENSRTTELAAEYVTACHKTRELNVR